MKELLALTLLLAPLPAIAATFTAQELENLCKDVVWVNDAQPGDTISVSRQIGNLSGNRYMAGIIDLGAVWRTMSQATVPFCTPPDGISALQGCKIFNKHSAAHPETLHIAAPVVASIALREAFPCPAK